MTVAPDSAWRVLACHVPEDEPAMRVTQADIAAAIARSAWPKAAVTLRTLDLGDPGMAAALAWCDVLVGWRLPLELIRAHGRGLRLVQLVNAGVDNVYPFDWLPPGAALCNARGIHGPKLQEWATMVLLMLHAQMPHFFTAQRAHGWHRRTTSLIRGKHVAIFGTGGLGAAVGRAARALGLATTGVRRSSAPAADFDTVVDFAARGAVLAAADFVVFTLPLTPETRGIGDGGFFAQVKPGAGFANFGRGALVDQGALGAALASGRLGGAVIDVTTPEPLPVDSPLWEAPNLIITPHVSCDDPTTYVADSLDILIDNLGRLAAGAALRNRVDLALAY